MCEVEKKAKNEMAERCEKECCMRGMSIEQEIIE